MKTIQTFGDLALLFSEIKKPLLKESSFQLLNFNINRYIIPNFSDIELNSISQDVISQRIICLKNTGNNPAAKTKSIIFKTVKQILSFGMHQGYIKPMLLDFQIPDVTINFKSMDKTILTDEEIQKIFSIACQKPERENLGVFLSLILGLRIGEICALKWNCITLKKDLYK